jgi:DNA-binding transcriptional MerR regulator
MTRHAGLVTVGEFSRLTHLTVKTLHHYDDVGLLDPADVDPVTGYRYYALDQVASAQLIRRLRAVRMPVPQVRAVLGAPDATVREGLIAAHLDQLRRELADTAAAVANLQLLLTGGAVAPSVTTRDIPDLPGVVATGRVGRDLIGAWCAQVYPRLYALAGRLGGVAGPAGALYGDGWFEDARGEVTAFVPLTGAAEPAPAPDGVPRAAVVRGGRYAVALHSGPFDDIDRTYAALGSQVTAGAHGRIGAAGPIREIYLVSPDDTPDPAGIRTEVCWPLLTAPATDP